MRLTSKQERVLSQLERVQTTYTRSGRARYVLDGENICTQITSLRVKGVVTVDRGASPTRVGP